MQLQLEESPSWVMALARKVLGAVMGEAYTGSLSVMYLVVGELGDCWAVFLVTIVLSSLVIPAG